MNGRFRYAVHLLVLVFYCGYAISPIYLSLAMNQGSARAGAHQQAEVTLGIVWVNVLLSQVLPGHAGAPRAETEVSGAAQEREFILVRKKRAVLRETCEVRPVLTEQTLPAAGEISPDVLRRVSSVPVAVYGRSKDHALPGHGGLAPPPSRA